jgi:hypothetical protein
MSKASAAAFCNEVAADPGLYADVVALSASSGAKRSVPAERLVELGARRGLSFSADEVREIWAERQAERASREIRDAELDKVVGGFGVTAHPTRKGGDPDFELADDFAP